MKDSLFAMLMSFFEQSLAQLTDVNATGKNPDFQNSAKVGGENSVLVSRFANPKSTRVLTEMERNKLSKASYQFLMKMVLCEFISPLQMEVVLHQALLSDSRFVVLQEIKWIIRNTLIANLDDLQVAFLDLVLYQQEDKLVLH